MHYPKAVIIGMGPNGLGIVRSLAIHHIQCIVLASHWDPTCKTNTCKIIQSSSWTKNSVINGLKKIGQRLDYRAPLLITKDEAVCWISECREELSEYFIINLPDSDVVDFLMNKQLFFNKAVKEGWPVPYTWIVANEEDLMACLHKIVFPCILKPATRNSIFMKNSPLKVFKISNQKELINTYKIVVKLKKEIVIQEWIEGGDDRLTFCLVYYDQNNKQLSSFAGRKLQVWPIECGSSVLSEPVPKKWETAINDLTGKIFRTINFSGLGSIEFKMRAGNDEPVIMEPTVGRTDNLSEIAVINGHNIPAVAYFNLTGSRYFPKPLAVKPYKLVDGSNENKSSWEYFRKQKLSIKQLIKNRQGKRKYMLLRINDLGPFIASMLDEFYRQIRHILISQPAKSILGQNLSKKLISAIRRWVMYLQGR